LLARPQDGDQEVEDVGAFVNASRTRTQRAVFLAGRPAQRFVVGALGLDPCRLGRTRHN
jgi:hypothetical protein